MHKNPLNTQYRTVATRLRAVTHTQPLPFGRRQQLSGIQLIFLQPTTTAYRHVLHHIVRMTYFSVPSILLEDSSCYVPFQSWQQHAAFKIMP